MYDFYFYEGKNNNESVNNDCGNCGALRDLVLFVQFKNREKHPWRSVNFKPATLLKLTLLHGCFSPFSNFTNSTKSRSAPHLKSQNNFGSWYHLSESSRRLQYE